MTPSVIAPGTAGAAGLAFPITGGRLGVSSLAGVALSGAAATVLNQAFGTTALTAGLAIGVADARGAVR